MARIVVIGGGITGLGAGLMLARAGHDVVIIERDGGAIPNNADADADAAWEAWDRRGVAHFHQPHAFLARGRQLLAQRLPDVVAPLAEIALPIRFIDEAPPAIAPLTPEPGDEDLIGFGVRRPTLELIVRRAAERQSGLTIRAGVAVEGLLTGEPSNGRPRVTGVVLGDSAHLPADLVIDAAGRHSALPSWLRSIGAKPPPETSEDCGVAYYSRWYRLTGPPPRCYGGFPRTDLGFANAVVFRAEHGIVNLLFGGEATDAALRPLLHAGAFQAAAMAVPVFAPWADPDASTPISGPLFMGRLKNTRRRVVVDGRPVVTGIVPLGDAAVHTDPAFGRGLSLGLLHATCLVDALDATGDDLSALATSLEQRTVASLDPWYDAAVMADRARMEARRRFIAGEPPDPANALPTAMAAAVQQDPYAYRRFQRMWNLLDDPASFFADPEMRARAEAAMADGDDRPPAPPGIDRERFLRIIDAAS